MTRRNTTLVGAAAVCVGALALLPTTAGGQTETCDQPYAPVAAGGRNVVDGEFGEEIPALDAALVSRSLVVTNGFDSDGDGVDDTVADEPGGGLRITRGDGDLVLTTDGPARAYRVGDVDGDGRDEIAVLHGGFQGGTYLIPGTTAAGTTTPTAAGIRMPGETDPLTYLDDGSGRLIAHIGEITSAADDRTDVFDAATVLALGAGGDAAGLTPEQSVPGTLQIVADLGGELVLLVGRTLGSPARVEVTLVDGTTLTRLTTAPERLEQNAVAPYGSLSVLDGPDGTFVRLDQSSRAGGASYLWSLDDPCTALVVDDDTTTSSTPTTPTAPPAQPVPGEADLTG